MPTIGNNAEGFTTSPTTPTTGNTGGASGNACSTVTQGTASTIRATTGSALFGTYGYEFNLVGSGTDGACRLMWAFVESVRVVFSTYWEVDAAITATEDVMGVRHASGNMGILLVGSDGKLIMQHAGGSSITASKATNALATGTRYRIEMSVGKGTTTSNGTLGFAYFLGDSATPEYSWESATENSGTANAATVWIGRSTGRTQARTVKYDEVRAATTASGWLAPLASNTAPTANAGVDQSILSGAAFTLDGSGSTDPDGTIATYDWQPVSGPTITLSGSGATRTGTAPYAMTTQTKVWGLVVTDDDGADSTQDTMTMTIAAHPEWYHDGTTWKAEILSHL